MLRLISITTLLLVPVLATSCAPKPVEPEMELPRAVILITVDGLIPDELSLFGGATATPGFERLASRGAAWDDVWTAAPMTRPAVTTYLTGLAPDRHRVRDDLFAPFDGSAPTLATVYADAGHSTAAFPDSSFLGQSSGLLADFEVVSQPPALPVTSQRWIPETRTVESITDDFDAWLESIPRGSSYFAWVHLSGPLVAQIWDLTTAGLTSPELAAKRVAMRTEREGSPVMGVDRTVAHLLDRLDARGDLDHALVAVAGTIGDVVGAAGEVTGAGYSVGETALRTAVVIGFPVGSPEPRDGGAVWAPDVPATIAQAAGLELSADAEGVSLFDPVAQDRIQFAWAWAALDQMGWRAARAARSGNTKWVVGSTSRASRLDGDGEPDAGETARLKAALAERAEPAAPAVPLDRVRPLLEAHGLVLKPFPSDGRDVATPALRREMSQRLLGAREALRRGRLVISREMYERLMEEDPEAPAPLLDRGQYEALRGDAQGLEYLGLALQSYPTDPELLHWYAHALWPGSWQEAGELLELVEPYKPQDADVLYDLACLRSLSDDLDASESYLRQAIEAGFTNFPHIETDPDLRNLRASGRFSEVLAEFKR